MNTGARVTYAMGKDDEVPEHFGMLHAESLSPRKSIWTLAWISAVIGVIAVSLVFGDAGAPTDATIAALPHGIFSSFGLPAARHAGQAAQLAAGLDADLQLRHLHPLRAELLAVHRGVSRRPDHSFFRHTLIPGIRPDRQPHLHGVLRGRARSSTSAPRWNLLLRWASRRYGASMGPFTSCDRQRPRANRSCLTRRSAS